MATWLNISFIDNLSFVFLTQLFLSLQKLDPAVMHVSCIHAGTLLARLARPEVKNCIAGLEQYSYSYEEAGDQAAEMRRLYDRALAAGPEFSYMAQVTPRTVSPETATSMVVDEHQDLKTDSSHVSY